MSPRSEYGNALPHSDFATSAVGQTGSRASCCRPFARRAISPAPGVISEGAPWDLACCLLVGHVIGNHIGVCQLPIPALTRKTHRTAERIVFSPRHTLVLHVSSIELFIHSLCVSAVRRLGIPYLLVEPMHWGRHLSPDKAGNDS